MKKLFVSCPMRGRKRENIVKSMEQMHRIAEIVFDQELEVIPTLLDFVPDDTKNKSLWCLGKSIQLMAEADFYIGVEGTGFYRGCMIENDIARKYGIRSAHLNIDELMQDALNIERKHFGIVEANACIEEG